MAENNEIVAVNPSAGAGSTEIQVVASGSGLANHNRNRVRSFRTIQNEAGEITYEFESDSETEALSDDFASTDPVQSLQWQTLSGLASSNLAPESGSDSDPDYSPLDQPTPGPSSNNNLSRELEDSPSAGSSRTPSCRRRQPRRKRRRAAPKGKKRLPKKCVKTASTPRPLQPKTVIRPHQSMEEESHFELLIGSCSHRCFININSNSVNNEQAEDVDSFLLGSPEVTLIRELVELPSFSIENLSSILPGVEELILHINEKPDHCILEIRIYKKLSDDECKEHKMSCNLKKSELRRIYYYIDELKYYFQIDLGGPYFELFAGLAVKRLFSLDVCSYDHSKKILKINAKLRRSAISPEHLIEDARERNIGHLSAIAKHFFGIEKIESSEVDQTLMQGKEDIEWFYGQVKKYHKSEMLPAVLNFQNNILDLELREYQKKAVNWMLHREKVFSSNDYQRIKSLVDILRNQIYSSVNLFDSKKISNGAKGSSLYYNPYFGKFAWNLPYPPEITSGGILSDEMGLGKTIVVLTVILLNQRRDEKKEETAKAVARIDEVTKSTNSEIAQSSTREAVDVKDQCQLASDSSNPNPRSPNKRKRRATSPCEFETMGAVYPLPLETNSADTEDAVIEEESYRQQRKRSGKAKSDKQQEQQTSTYSRVKVLYDAALSQYSERAVITKKFHGQFFNPNIEPKASFACICGEAKENNSRHIVTCGVCLCSQHADCVGYGIGTSLRYLCPHCIVNAEPIQAKTTLVVTPSTISHQWIQEIQKHVKSTHLKIFFYKGVQKCRYIPPSELAKYDIIITTYTTLSTELNYVDLPHCSSADSRQFRNPKRYLTIPSPLLSVHWWRICLDEAQMVEGSTTKVAMMALRLKSTHRWCVTGTPLNKGLEDLFGLIAFLEVPWLSLEFWWNELVTKVFYQKKASELVYELFGQLVWRTCKTDVLDQLGIPKQSEVLHWTAFSPLETHFYKRQYETCSNKILEKINDSKHSSNIYEDISTTKLAQLDRNTLKCLLQPFLMLRQACVHPQMVKGNWISLNKLKSTLTMEDLLDQLIRKSALQCTEDNRLIVSSFNALAGLYLLKEDYKEAAAMYREVLQQERKYQDKFRTDKLQMIHTLENLADLLDLNIAGIGFTLRDDSLRSEANELKRSYLESYASEVESARTAVQPFTKTILEINSQLSTRTESWWVSALTRAARMSKDDTLLERIKDELSEKSTKRKNNVGSIANQFNDCNGLENVLIGKIVELDELRNSVLEALDELEKVDPKSFVEAAAICHLRKQKDPTYNENYEPSGGFACTLCIYHDRFLKYESALFVEEKSEKISRTGRNWQKVKLAGRTIDQLSKDELDAVLLQEQEELIESTEHAQLKGVLKRGNWGASETERALKIILSFAKANGGEKWGLEDGNIHIKLLDTAKKEFRLNRVLWRKIFDQVSALDELQQATTRLRLATAAATGMNEAPSTSSNLTSRRKQAAPKRQLDYAITGDERILNINIVHSHEIEPRIEQSQLDLARGKHDLAVHMGQIIYLETLKKNNYGKKGTANTEDCTICCNQLGHQWSVLICGHSFCSECVKKMCPNPLQAFLCPICRISMRFRDISFVDTKIEVPEPEPQATSSQGLPSLAPAPTSSNNVWSNAPLIKEIKGSNSSKVELIVATLLKLQLSHPSEKVIIFSSWLEVLEIISRALDENEIHYCLLSKGKLFKETLNRFKTKEYIQVLLMPLTSGSKGLNIIEATHVFLVEPTLNIANELQAIGRVHRIGQTKPTFVHRFYVRSTIEEHLYEVLKSHDICSDEEGSLTVGDLENLVRK